MRYAVIFGILGVVLAALACRLTLEAVGAWWLVVFIEAYLAACLLSLALAYGLRHVGLPVEEVLGHPAWSPALGAVLTHTGARGWARFCGWRGDGGSQ